MKSMFALILTFMSAAAFADLSPEVYNNQTMNEAVDLMSRHLLEMDCKPLTKSIRGTLTGPETLTYKADDDVCNRNHVINNRLFYRTIPFEMSLTSKGNDAFTFDFSLTATYPIGYLIPEQQSILFFQSLATLIEMKFLSGFVRGSADEVRLDKNGLGTIVRTYEAHGAKVLFKIIMTLGPSTDKLADPSRIVVRVTTAIEA